MLNTEKSKSCSQLVLPHSQIETINKNVQFLAPKWTSHPEQASALGEKYHIWTEKFISRYYCNTDWCNVSQILPTSSRKTTQKLRKRESNTRGQIQRWNSPTDCWHQIIPDSLEKQAPLATIHSKKHTLPALTFSSRSLKAQLISWRWLWVFLDWDWCFVLIYIYTYIDIYVCPLQSWTTKASSHRGWLAQHRKQLISNTKDFMAWMKVEKSGKIPKLSLLPFALLCSELQKEQWWCPEISRHAIKMRDFSSSSYSYLNWITGCVATGKLQTPNEALPGRYAPGLFMELTQRVLLILGWTSFCSNPWQDGSVPWR